MTQIFSSSGMENFFLKWEYNKFKFFKLDVKEKNFKQNFTRWFHSKNGDKISNHWALLKKVKIEQRNQKKLLNEAIAWMLGEEQNCNRSVFRKSIVWLMCVHCCYFEPPPLAIGFYRDVWRIHIAFMSVPECYSTCISIDI